MEGVQRLALGGLQLLLLVSDFFFFPFLLLLLPSLFFLSGDAFRFLDLHTHCVCQNSYSTTFLNHQMIDINHISRNRRSSFLLDVFSFVIFAFLDTPIYTAQIYT